MKSIHTVANVFHARSQLMSELYDKLKAGTITETEYDEIYKIHLEHRDLLIRYGSDRAKIMYLKHNMNTVYEVWWERFNMLDGSRHLGFYANRDNAVRMIESNYKGAIAQQKRNEIHSVGGNWESGGMWIDMQEKYKVYILIKETNRMLPLQDEPFVFERLG